MKLPERENIYEFGGFVVDPAQRLLLRNGAAVTIGPKAFDALVYLVEHAGQIVERNELTSALWPNMVVEDNNLSQTILALRRALNDSKPSEPGQGDLGIGDTEGGRFVLTVPRRGYQFVAEVVRRPRSRSAHADPNPEQTKPPVRRNIAWKASAVVGVVLLVVASLLVWQQRRSVGVQPQNSSRTIAVLPFANLSPNPQDAYFAAGIHEEVMTRLAKLRGVTVVARTAVMQYAKDEGRSIEAIAQALEVDSVMEGSVRYAADRVRVTVRLVGSNGKELWGEMYEAPLRDVFDIQTNIATQISAALESELTPAERKNLSVRPTESMEAYALYLKALVLYRSAGALGVSMPAQLRQSIKQLLEESLVLDPKFYTALGWRAQLGADSLQFDSFPLAERAERIAQLNASIERDANAALTVDPSIGIAHAALLRRNLFQYHLADGLATLENAQKTVLGDTFVWQAAAVLHCARNDPDAAIVAAHRAIELDVRNPGPYSLLSIALRVNGKLDEAIAAYEQMIELAPNAVIGYVGLARTLTAKGDTPRLRETLKVAEQFLGAVRNYRVDAALSYASIGAHADAERLIAEFRRTMQGQYVDPGLEAMALLALSDHDRARDAIREALNRGRHGMDQLPLVLIRYNSWSDPVLDTPEWKKLREELAYRGE